MKSSFVVGSETESETTTSHDGGAIAKRETPDRRSPLFTLTRCLLAGSFILERTTLWASQLGGPVRAGDMLIEFK